MVTLSKKHGLNPSVEICNCCGEEMSVVLFGSEYKNEKGEHTEAPYKVNMGNICDKCKKVIDEGGIFFIEVRDGESGNNPYRTGRVIAVKESAVKEILNGYAKINYMEQSLFSRLFPKIE